MSAVSSRIAGLFLLAGSLVLSAAAEEGVIRVTVHADQPGARFSPTMHGVFFEDINYAADGGLYAELVQNRSFEHRNKLFAWSPVGEEVELTTPRVDGLHENNPGYCRVEIGPTSPEAGLSNSGFDGFAVRKGAKYYASAHLRSRVESAKASVVLRGADGAELARAELGETTPEWRRREVELTPSRDDGVATLEVLFDKPGQFDVDVVSLFPADTFHGRRNGLRKDLAQRIADLHPSFVRFPGGCIVEGRTLDNAYKWKDTVGPIWQRKQNYNLWTNRESPQYHQTYGLGFFEFFQYCEDVGAEAVPIVNCGMACQARGGAPAAMEELGPWVQDALDLVEFANGPITSKWGKLRAEMGHPEPFNLKYLGVGNEQWMEGYFERYLVFHAALKQRYPDLQVVSTSGPQASDPFYHYAWSRFRSDIDADVVDEHYYRPPQWFLSNSTRYDEYDRSGPTVFAGEFAAHEPDRASTLRAAVAEAAFMTGLWRNADVVSMASYAPLFARVGAVQWAPDLIWFDNTRSYGTPSYYVQAMYGENVPDAAVPVTLDASAVPPPRFHGRVGLGTWLTRAEFKDIRVTDRQGNELFESDGSLDGWQTFRGDWSAEEGVIRQSSDEENVRAFVGDPSWSDYTLTLKARKLSGREGFLVSFASTNPQETSWWNLGGWGNTLHGVEAPSIPQQRTEGAIEEGRWYDVRIDVQPAAVICYLDGVEVQHAELSPTPALYAAAGIDEAANEVVMAVANPYDTPRRVRLELDGAELSGPSVAATLLTSGSATDVNTLENPEKVAPEQVTLGVKDGAIDYVMPAQSFVVARAPAAP